MSRDLRLDALLSIPALFGPLVSPDGRWVAWSWSRLGPAADVFAAPTDGSQPPLRLTETVEGDTEVVSWTPEGEAVLVSQDNDGDERVRLFRVRLAEPGAMEPLTAASPNYYLRGGQLHQTAAGSSTPPTSTPRAERRSRPTGSTGTTCRRTKGWCWPT